MTTTWNHVDVFRDYMAGCQDANVWFDVTDPTTAGNDAAMKRWLISAQVSQRHHVHDSFLIHKLETAWFAQQLTDELLPHPGVVSLADLQQQFYAQPHHKRDIPTMMLPLLEAGVIAPEDEVAALCWAWQTPEFPETTDNRDDWVGAFTGLGFICDETGTCSQTYPVTVYHGGSCYEPLGMAWSTDKRTAELFASRYGPQGTVTTATVDNDAGVLAHLTSRGENELVLHTDQLRAFENLR